jgi:tripeptide aminopeptidase
MRIFGIALLAVLTANSVGAQTADAHIQQLVASNAFKEATAFLGRDYDRFVSELIALTEIPAPPFKVNRTGIVGERFV